MRRRVSRYTTALVTLVAATSWVAGTVGSRAAGTGDVWIQQAGNGAGKSDPVIKDFGLMTVLFSESRFQECSPTTNCIQRPTSKYVAWGTITNTVSDPDLGEYSVQQLAMSEGGDDGLRWSTPTPAAIQNSTGQSAPFAMGANAENTDVVFTGDPQAPFLVYYLAAGDTSEAYAVSRIHRAESQDGIHWVNDKAISEVATSTDTKVIASGTFKTSSYGPSDIIFQASKSSSCTTAANFNPWDCKYVMLYDATDSVQHTGIAGSGDGLAFRGVGSAILRAGDPGSWDEQSATLAHARLLPGGEVELYYSGANQPPSDCEHIGQPVGSYPCWSIGTASGSSLSFTKSPANPVVPSTLLDQFGAGKDPSTLSNVQVVDAGTTPAKIYFTRTDDDGKASAYLAYTAPPPGQAPKITFSSPSGAYRNFNETPIELYVTDTLGTQPAKIGPNLSTFSLTVDGTRIGYVTADSLVTSYTQIAQKITAGASRPDLPDGPHRVIAKISDLDGNETTEIQEFTIDTTGPVTILESTPPSPQVGFPDSIGTFTGRTQDGSSYVGVGIARLRAVVTDPLGQTKTYTTPNPGGFSTNKLTSNVWEWQFVAPALDTFYLVPGNYTVSILGVDNAGNVESPNTDNTATVLVI